MRVGEVVAAKAKREHIQQKIELVLFRFATRNGWLAFAPEERLLKHLGIPSSTTRNPTYRLREAVQRLTAKGLVEWEHTGSGWKTRLTKQGVAHARTTHAADRVHIPKPKKWDGRWRMVIFDVWESRRNVRNALRMALQKAGFLRVQDSVWIHPYDCEELVAFLRTELRLGGSVIYVVAEGIEHDEKFKRHFQL